MPINMFFSLNKSVFFLNLLSPAILSDTTLLQTLVQVSTCTPPVASYLVPLPLVLSSFNPSFKTSPHGLFPEWKCNLASHSLRKDFQWLPMTSIHLSVQSLSQHLLNAHHVPGTVMNSDRTELNEMNRVPALVQLAVEDTLQTKVCVVNKQKHRERTVW